MATHPTGLEFFHSSAAVGMHLRHLLDIIEAQAGIAMSESGCRIKANTTGIVWLLHCKGPQSLSDIASQLRYSHQLATQRVGWLQRNGFVGIALDKYDRRRRAIALSAAGKREAKKFESFLQLSEKAYANLFEEIGVDLLKAVNLTEKALVTRPLGDRVQQKQASTSSGYRRAAR